MAEDSADFMSSMLASGRYDDEKQAMVLVFQNGAEYVFDRVPADIWNGLKGAPSAGAFFNQMIKGRF